MTLSGFSNFVAAATLVLLVACSASASARKQAVSGGCTTGDDNIYQQFKDQTGNAVGFDFVSEYKGQITIPANPQVTSGHVEWVYMGVKNNVDSVRPLGAVMALWDTMPMPGGTTIGAPGAWSVYAYYQSLSSVGGGTQIAGEPLPGVTAGSVVNATIAYTTANNGTLTMRAQLSSGGSISQAVVSGLTSGFNLIQNVVSHCGSFSNCNQFPGTSVSNSNPGAKAVFSNLSVKTCSGSDCSSPASYTPSFVHSVPSGVDTTCGTAHDAPTATRVALGPW